MSNMKVVPALILGAMFVCGLQSGWSQDSTPSQDTSAKKDAKKAAYAANAAARNGSRQKPANVVQVGTKGAGNPTKHAPHHDPEGTQPDSTTHPQ